MSEQVATRPLADASATAALRKALAAHKWFLPTCLIALALGGWQAARVIIGPEPRPKLRADPADPATPVRPRLRAPVQADAAPPPPDR